MTGLQPATQYNYTFQVCNNSSAGVNCTADGAQSSGRFRTLPAPGANVTAYSFATVACADWPAGFYNAYQVLASKNFSDLGFVLHLGDYYYEYTVTGPDSFPPFALGLEVPERVYNVTTSPDYPRFLATQPISVDDFRARHRLTKSDPAVQAVHSRHAFIVTWDDHEFRNNIYSRQPGTQILVRNALRAYYEWMPIREPPACAGQPPGLLDTPACVLARLDAFRVFPIGKLATLVTPESRVSARTRSLFDYPISSYSALLGTAASMGALFVNTSTPSLGFVQPAMQNACNSYESQLRSNLPPRQILGQAQINRTVAAFVNGNATWHVLASQTLMQSLKAPSIGELTATLDKSTAAAFERTMQRVVGSLSVPGVSPAPDGQYTGFLRQFFNSTVSEYVLAFLAAGHCNATFNLDSWDGYATERQQLFVSLCTASPAQAPTGAPPAAPPPPPSPSMMGNPPTGAATPTNAPNPVSTPPPTSAAGTGGRRLRAAVSGDPTAGNATFGSLCNGNLVVVSDDSHATFLGKLQYQNRTIGHDLSVGSVTAPSEVELFGQIMQSLQRTPIYPWLSQQCVSGCNDTFVAPANCDSCGATCPQSCYTEACCAIRDALVTASVISNTAESGFKLANNNTLDYVNIGSDCHGFMLHSFTTSAWNATPICQPTYLSAACSANTSDFCPYFNATTYSIPANGSTPNSSVGVS